MGKQKSFNKFTIFWTSQMISEIGGAVNIFAINLLLADVIFSEQSDKTELSFALAAVTGINYLTYILIQPFAGSWTDKFDRKKILMFSNFIGLISTIILFFLIYNQVYYVVIFIIYSGILGILKAFIISSFTASYILIVPEKHLTRANGMTTTAFSFSKVLAPSLALFMISITNDSAIFDGSSLNTGISIVILFDSLTFLIGGLILLFMHIPSPEVDKKKQETIWKDFLKGIKFMDASLIWLLSLSAFGNLLMPMVITLQPVVVRYVATSTDYNFDRNLAILTTLTSAGGLVGGLLITTFGGFKKIKNIYGVLAPLFLVGIFLIGYGLSPHIYLTAAFGFIMFLMLPIMNAHAATIWQRRVPKEIQGRVFAVRRIVSQFTLPISSFLSGLVGANFSPGIALSLFGIALTAFCIFQFFNSKLIKIEHNFIQS